MMRSIYFPTWQRWGFSHQRNDWVEARLPLYVRRPFVLPLVRRQFEPVTIYIPIASEG